MRSHKTITFMDWSTPDSRASHISGKYHEWQSYKEKAMARWEETEAYVYATDTTSLPGGTNFDHTTHIPIVHEIYEELCSILYSTVLPHEDYLGWLGFDSEANTREKRDKALAYIKNRHSLNGFRKSIDTLISDLVIYGICFAQVQHVNRSLVGENGIGVSGYIGPVVKRFSPYDVTIDPTAPSFEASPKVIRSLVSMGEFIALAEKGNWDKEVVQGIIDKRGSYSGVDFSDKHKNKQYTPDGFGNIELYYQSGMVELLWFYGDVFDEDELKVHRNRCIVVADRCRSLSDTECLHPDIFCATWKAKPDNLWSQGPLDQIVGLNYQINHRENALSTSIDRFIFPDRVHLGDVEVQYNPSNGNITYYAPEGGGVQDLSPDATVLTYDNQIEKLSSKARMAVGLPPSLAGFRSPGEKTAFEVQSLHDGAFRSFVHKAERFEMDVVEKVVNAELRLGLENLDSVLQVPAQSPDGLPTFLKITREDLTSNGKLVPWGARRFTLQNKQLNVLSMLANSNLGQLIGAHMNTYKLARVVEELGGLNDFKVFDKFAAIEEQFEQQQLVNMAQQMQASELQRPSLEEEMLNG